MAENSNNQRWFIVHTRSGYEQRVKEDIHLTAENRGLWNVHIFNVAVPMLKKTVKKEVKDPVTGETKIIKKVKSKVRYPGYVYVKVSTEIKYEIASSNRPISKDEIDALNGNEEYNEVIAMDDDAWYIIRNTKGVTGFVGPKSKPIPVEYRQAFDLGLEKKLVVEEENETFDDSDMFADFGNDEIDFSIPRHDFNIGDEVELIGGEFKGMSGTIIEINENSMSVELDIFGRATPTEVAFDEATKK